MSDDPYERGMAVRREVLGDAHVDASIAAASELTPDFQELITRYAWGEIWARPGLDRRTRSCITLTALVAGGHHDELAAASARGAPQRPHLGRDQGGAAADRDLLRRARGQLRVCDRPAGLRGGGGGMSRAVILSAVRTPIGRYGGALAACGPTIWRRWRCAPPSSAAGVEPEQIEDVYLGCANQAGEDNRDVARMAVLLAGLPQSVPGRDAEPAVRVGARGGRLGLPRGDRRRRRPVRRRRGRVDDAGAALDAEARRARSSAAIARSTTRRWAGATPTRAWRRCSRSRAWARRARTWPSATRVSREEQDAFAAALAARWAAAQAAGPLRRRARPVERRSTATSTRGRDTTAEGLAALRPAFRAGGSVTAGNSSGMNDGAAALVIASEERAAALGAEPLASVPRQRRGRRRSAGDGDRADPGGAQAARAHRRRDRRASTSSS